MTGPICSASDPGADAMYAPGDTVLNLPDMIEWIEAAKAEPLTVEELEAEF